MAGGALHIGAFPGSSATIVPPRRRRLSVHMSWVCTVPSTKQGEYLYWDSGMLAVFLFLPWASVHAKHLQLVENVEKGSLIDQRHLKNYPAQ